ncbi:MAG: N-6 DNA methylase [Undibacterium sp.]|uniref:N-6 DNA methylase n=1 Tax=Undibacterium sp. TaxID=1914977 RepID=UPI0027208B83|nr:N-6 DNA methylase [Undibacterium sp.]MDO8653491.1 N-6 DNA methylase [Undibacterium sp.]
MQDNRQALGQYMTPDIVANLVARNIPSGVTQILDLAAGDCSLLRAAQKRRSDLELFGYEIDSDMHRRARQCLPSAKVSLVNGLTGRLHKDFDTQNQIAVVGNPPFTEMVPTDALRKILFKAFPGLTTKLGGRRSEVYFLARSLLIAKVSNGTVAILMPISFADGDIYSQYRSELMKNYAIRKVIEIPENAFIATEARTVLLIIDTSLNNTKQIDIGRFDVTTEKVSRIYKGQLHAGDRLDARYYDGRTKFDAHALQLKDVGVTVTRGVYSHKEAKTMALGAIHTSDLARARNGKMSLNQNNGMHHRDTDLLDNAMAYPGDILLPRTGSRVIWSPVIVSDGSAPITDHVFRIRVPSASLEAVKNAFMHPNFNAWLKCTSKGVCATVLTKRELLTMPLFS